MKFQDFSRLAHEVTRMSQASRLTTNLARRPEHGGPASITIQNVTFRGADAEFLIGRIHPLIGAISDDAQNKLTQAGISFDPLPAAATQD